MPRKKVEEQVEVEVKAPTDTTPAKEKAVKGPDLCAECNGTGLLSPSLGCLACNLTGIAE